MAYEHLETEEGWKQVVTPDPPENPPVKPTAPAPLAQRPMLLQMPILQQAQMPFPFISFLFPRLSSLLTMMQGRRQGGMGLKNITQIVRDKNGYISEIVEFVR